MINELIKLSTHLDSLGYHREADCIGSMIKKMSTEIEEPEQLGEVINLDEFRRSRNKPDKPPSRERQDPKVLMENWQALQDAIDDVQNISERYPASTSGRYPVTEDRLRDADERRSDLNDIYLVVLDDGETYSGEASVVKTTPEDLKRIEEGEKVYNVIPPDHEALKSKWKDIWDVIKTDDLY